MSSADTSSYNTAWPAAKVVAELLAQHRDIEAELDALAAAGVQTRQPLFSQLRHHLAVHEMTEQEIVHPRAAVELADGAAIVADRLAEEARVFDAVITLDSTQIDSQAFADGVDRLRAVLLAHLEAEQTLEFGGLRIELGVRQARRMDNGVRLHTSTVSATPGETLSALLARTRDAIHGDEHVGR